MRYSLILLIALIIGCTQSEKSDSQKIAKEEPKELVSQASLKNMNVNDLKNNRTEVEVYMGYNWFREEHEWDINYGEYLKYRDILNLDVLKYYSLENEYNSELQKKMFLESNDFKNKLQSLKLLKQEITENKYFIDWRLDESDLNRFIYNLDNQSFTLDNFNPSYYSSDENYFVFTDIVLEIPYGITKTSERIKYYLGPDVSPLPTSPRYTTKQSLSFKVPNERVALKVEQNSSNVRVLFTFSFSEFKDDKIFVADVNAAIYNTSSGEIYMLYK